MNRSLTLGVVLIAGPASFGTLHGDAGATFEIPATYLVPLACPDGAGGLRGGADCLKKAPKRTELRLGERTIPVKRAPRIRPCGTLTTGLALTDSRAGVAPRTLAVWGAGDVGLTAIDAATFPLQLDLDGDGALETVEVVLDLESDAPTHVHLQITSSAGVTTTHDPFDTAWDITVLATSDVDGDGQRELILWASLAHGHVAAVLEYGATDAVYAFRCETA